MRDARLYTRDGHSSVHGVSNVRRVLAKERWMSQRMKCMGARRSERRVFGVIGSGGDDDGIAASRRPPPNRVFGGDAQRWEQKAKLRMRWD